MKIKIGFDIDDVVADYFSSMVAWHNQFYGTELKKEDAGSYYLSEFIGQNADETLRRMNAFAIQRMENLPLVKGAKESVEALSKKHEIYFITSRRFDWRDSTLRWVERHFSRNHENVLFSHNHYIPSEKEDRRETKAEMCKRLRINFMIEDSPEYAYQISEVGVPVLLFDQPWNRNVNCAGIYRVHDHREILYYLD
jgi:uncharacterized HAD superfamily protein